MAMVSVKVMTVTPTSPRHLLLLNSFIVHMGEPLGNRDQNSLDGQHS